MPTASALKARLLRGKAASGGTADSNKVPPVAKGKSSRPLKQASRRSKGSDDDMADGSSDGSSDEYRNPESGDGAEPGDDSEPGDDDEPDDGHESAPSDDDVPLVTLKKGARARRAGTAAAASRKPAALDPTFNENAAIYSKVKIPTPAAYYRKHEASLDKALWEKVRDFLISYTNEDSDAASWPEKLAKIGPSKGKTVDLPPVPRETALVARKKHKSLWPSPSSGRC